MKVNGSFCELAAVLLAACGLGHSQGNVPPARRPPGGEKIHVRRNLGAFPAGQYQLLRSFRVETAKLVNRRQTHKTDEHYAFTFDMAFQPPGKAPGATGHMTCTVRRVVAKRLAGYGLVYDSAGKTDEQTPLLARQFGHLVGATSKAKFGSSADRIVPDPYFHGLGAAWDKLAKAHPDLAAAAKTNRLDYGDAMLNAMLADGAVFLRIDPFVPGLTDVTGERLRPTAPRPENRRAVGDTWEVRRQHPGLNAKGIDVVYACRLLAIQDGHAVVAATWRKNDMKTKAEPNGMTIVRGLDEKGSAKLTVHAASGLVTEFASTLERVNQLATRTAQGRVTQLTTQTRRTSSWSIRPKGDRPGGA